MAGNAEVTCHHCDRVYSRLEHLQRHLLSYSTLSPHKCPRCHRCFKRKDALTRHSHTCSSRPTPSTHCHERACQRCARNKRRCSRGKPSCRQCVRAGISCQYQGQVQIGVFGAERCDTGNRSQPPAAASTYESTPSQNTEDYSQGTSSFIVLETPSEIDLDTFDSLHSNPLMGASLQVYLPSTLAASKFSFLLHFTAQYSLKNSFGIPSHVRSWTSDLDTYLRHDTTGVSTMTALPDPDMEATSLPANDTSQHAASKDLAISGLPINSQNELPTDYGISCDIYAAIQPILHRRCRTTTWSRSGLFAPQLIASSLESYWSNWHPNWPVIHKPTFSIGETPPALLAAMMVMGSCYSTTDHSSGWFDAVEDFAFDELQSMSRSAPIYQKMRAIQAAYLACIFQTWDGGTSPRTRIRRYRFASIVNFVRDLDMSTIRHSRTATNFEHFDWLEFIRMEECIRTLLWVFQLDTAYVIFNNMPSHFALRELTMGLASPEMVYQAPSPHECFGFLHNWLKHNTRAFDLTLYGLIRSFFRPNLSEAVLESCAHESFMNLWCVNAAFHVLLFHLDPMIGGEQQFAGLQAGIKNWEAVWNQRMMNNDERFFDAIVTTAAFSDLHERTIEPWQYPGFWKNAAEYWLLAKTILDRMVTAHESAMAADDLSSCTGLHVNVSPHIHGAIEDVDMRSLHSFLSTLNTESRSIMPDQYSSI